MIVNKIVNLYKHNYLKKIKIRGKDLKRREQKTLSNVMTIMGSFLNSGKEYQAALIVSKVINI